VFKIKNIPLSSAKRRPFWGERVCFIVIVLCPQDNLTWQQRKIKAGNPRYNYSRFFHPEKGRLQRTAHLFALHQALKNIRYFFIDYQLFNHRYE